MNEIDEDLAAQSKAQTPETEHPAAHLLRAAGPVLSVPVYAQIHGVSKSHVYDLIQRGELGLPVIRLGQRVVIPTAEVRKALGLDPEPGNKPAA